MESASAAVPAGAEPGGKGLKANAIGYLTNLVISIASVAPAYSLAATLGFIVAIDGMGVHAPAVMIVSFIPMLLIASAYNYMNRADPDCGTSFTWVTRAMGPRSGWITGWAIVVADVVVMATLAYIAGKYTFLLFNWDSAAHSLLAVSIVAAIWIAVMTWICYVGIELSAATQRILLSIEIITLALFAVVALVKVYTGGAPDASMHNGPGKAAVLSTILLVLIYVVVAASAQAFAGTEALTHHKNDVLASLGGPVLGSPLDKLLIITVLTSASASTQTTILPTARTTLSMARFGSIPSAFGKIHPRHLTPSVSTLAMGGVSLVWTLFIINVSQNVLGDSITGLGFQIAFYYGLTGFACAIYYRRELFRSARNFLMAGVVPFLGGAMLTYIFVKAFIDNAPVDSAYSGGVFGLGAADAIGVGLLLIGVVLMVFANFVYPRFFKRKLETAPPHFLERGGEGPAVDTVTPE
jgi:amino acid transporter